MHGLMRGGWKRGTGLGPQRLHESAWTAPDLAATAPASYSTPGPNVPGSFHCWPMMGEARGMEEACGQAL